jgi:hypothetical protein
MKCPLTSPQPSNAGGFRRLAVTKPTNDKGKQKQEQVNPLPAGRQAHYGCRALGTMRINATHLLDKPAKELQPMSLLNC